MMFTGSQNIITEIITTFLFFYTILDVCGFDSNLCGFGNDVSHKGRWGHKRASKNQVDHTYGTENGQYKTNQSLVDNTWK